MAEKPLRKHVKYRHGHQSRQHDKIVRFDKRQQFHRLSQAVDVKPQHPHHKRHQQREKQVGKQSVAYHRPDRGGALLTEQRTDKRGKSVGETKYRKCGDIKHIVDKRRRCECRRRIASHHYIVGKSHHNHAKLPYKDGQSELYDGDIVFAICFPDSIHDANLSIMHHKTNPSTHFPP